MTLRLEKGFEVDVLAGAVQLPQRLCGIENHIPYIDNNPLRHQVEEDDMAAGVASSVPRTSRASAHAHPTTVTTLTAPSRPPCPKSALPNPANNNPQPRRGLWQSTPDRLPVFHIPSSMLSSVHYY